MHEDSVTVYRPEGAANVYGVGPKQGQPLPLFFPFEKPFYNTLEEGVVAAQRRSDAFGALVEAMLKRTLEAEQFKRTGLIPLPLEGP